MHTKKELDEKLQKLGFQPIKKLGQNFLVNPKICEAIVGEALKSKPASLVEVGPGLGALTDSLIASGLPLWLVELDSGLAKFWESSAKPNVHVVHQDALKLDWPGLTLAKPSVLVSNLPYSISASLVIDQSLFDLFEKMVLMFQKEVAVRIQSSPGDEDYGMLTIMAQTFWNVEKLIDAGPQDFHPVPNVGSRVLTFRKKSSDLNREKFLSFVKAAFAQRRKKLSKNLQAIFKEEVVSKAFSTMDLSADARAQELTVEQFQSLFVALSK